MSDIARSGRICLLFVLSLFVTGCPSSDTARKAFDRAEAHMAQRQYSRALGEYDRALRLANTENLNDFASQIQQKIASVRAQIDENASEEVRAHMRDAERHAQSRNWSGMLSSLERAKRALDKIDREKRDQPVSAPNQLLREQLGVAMDSQPVKLAQTAQIYARMSREASWSNWQHWLRGDEWFTLWSEVSTAQLGNELNRRAVRTGDQAVMNSAGTLSTAWDKYWLAKVTSRNNDQRSRPGADDPTWVHVLSGIGDVIVAGNEIYQGSKFNTARQTFETQLDGALGRSRFPQLQLHQAPPAPPAAPVAAAPVAPSSSPVVTSVTPAVAPGSGSAPTGPVHAEDVVRTP